MKVVIAPAAFDDIIGFCSVDIIVGGSSLDYLTDFTDRSFHFSNLNQLSGGEAHAIKQEINLLNVGHFSTASIDTRQEEPFVGSLHLVVVRVSINLQNIIAFSPVNNVVPCSTF